MLAADATTIGGLDLAIVLGYFALVIAFGFWLRRRATRDTESFFLAGRGIPWWMLGLSGCSSYIDIGGTMGMIGLLFYLGFQGVWVTHVFWGWFIIAGYMAFQARWIRRSGVATFAEWNLTRFGQGRATEGARTTAAAFLLVLMLANLTFIAVGIGKFAPQYLPFDRVACTVLVLGVVGVYVTLGGFFGVIYTDILQTVLIAAGAIVLTLLALEQAPPGSWQGVPPAAWWSRAPGWSLGEEMLGGAPDYFQQFRDLGPLLIGGAIWCVARVLAGPNVWDFQFFLSARSPRDAQLAAGVWTVGYTFRWFLGSALLAFGLSFFVRGGLFDSEQIMPKVIGNLPVGLKGGLLAVLLAAFMSTFDAMINVTSSVAVNDFLRRFLLRDAGEKALVRLGQAFSLAVLAVATVLSLAFTTINEVWEAMIFSVVTAILAPSMLRWHWGRFNAQGFTIGVLATGAMCVADVLLSAHLPGYPPRQYTLPAIVLLSLGASVAAALATAPTPLETRVRFYAAIRPFGLWSRERREAIGRGLIPPGDLTPRLDLLNGILTAAFQVSLCLVPFHLLLGRTRGTLWSLAAVGFFGTILFFTWFRTLPAREDAPQA